MGFERQRGSERAWGEQRSASILNAYKRYFRQLPRQTGEFLSAVIGGLVGSFVKTAQSYADSGAMVRDPFGWALAGRNPHRKRVDAETKKRITAA
jgi:hypothetical protein